MFEGNSFEGNFSNRDIFDWTKKGTAILPGRVLSVPSFLSLYKEYFKQLLNTYFLPSGALTDIALDLFTMSDIAAQQDYWHHLDYAWSYQEYASNYQKSIYRDLKPPVIIDSIQQFVEERWSTAWNQLNKS